MAFRHAEGNESAARFHKIISQENIDEKRLKLPPKFVRIFKNKLPDIAKLKVVGQDWLMEIKREGSDIWLETGFSVFLEYYSLGYGHLLYFEYKGLSTFKVRIFDLSSCEITYPSRDHNLNAFEPTHQTNTNEARHGFTNADGFLSPRHFHSLKPYFDVKLKEYNFQSNVLYVSSDMAKALREEQWKDKSVELQLGDGRHWNVSLLCRRSGRFSFGKLTAFYVDNDLKEGDVCIFELVGQNVFKVYLFRAVGLEKNS